MHTPAVAGDRIAPIDMSTDEFRAVGHALVDRIAELLATSRERPVTGGRTVSEIRDLVHSARTMPDEGTDAATIVDEAADVLSRYSLFNGHPKFLGYVTSSPAPIGMLADLLAAAVNPNVGSWTLGPVATEIESQTVAWIADLLGYPASASGVLVSGGNMANFVGFYTALRAAFPRDSAERTPERLARATVYASGETHTWMDKAVDMFGLAPDARRIVAVDAERRLRIDDLEAQIERDVRDGRIPLLVSGSAGTVSTGAVDPLIELARVCQERGIWFHVDGAYGGFAAMLPSASPDLKALALADSVAIDPHKWLYAPLEAGCALVRDAVKHRAAFSYHPPYYHFGEEATNFVDLSPQNSRGFRALKVWMGLRHVGRRGYEQMIEDDIALARALYDRLADDDRFEVCTHSLSITTFRFVPASLRGVPRSAAVEAKLNEINRALQSRLETSGELFVSNAVIEGTYVLRACIVNFRTSPRDIEEIPDIVARHGEAVWAEATGS